MAQADSNNSTSSSRRRFLAVAAGASAASASALAAAAMPVHPACAVSDDSGLIRLEEEFFELEEKAAAYDDEIIRLSEIWGAESNRLYQEALAAEVRSGIFRTPQERWKLVTDLPECREHNRLCNLQEPFVTKMGALIKQMFATPAHTAEGRRAKVSVLLRVMGDDWCHVDEKTEYRELMARSLLIEFIGGEPGEAMRDQFA